MPVGAADINAVATLVIAERMEVTPTTIKLVEDARSLTRDASTIPGALRAHVRGRALCDSASSWSEKAKLTLGVIWAIKNACNHLSRAVSRMPDNDKDGAAEVRKGIVAFTPFMTQQDC